MTALSRRFRRIREKATFKPLSHKTRHLSVALLFAILGCLICSTACLVVVNHGAPYGETLRGMGIIFALASPLLLGMFMLSNFTGTVLAGIERYRRLDSAALKNVKGHSLLRLPFARISFLRAGHARARRSMSRSAASSAASKKDDSGDPDSGEPSDPSDSDPFSLTYLLTFPDISHKPNSLICPWLRPGCWRMLFNAAPSERGWMA